MYVSSIIVLNKFLMMIFWIYYIMLLKLISSLIILNVDFRKFKTYMWLALYFF